MCGCGISGNMINTGNTGNGQGGGLTVNDVNTLINTALANFTSGLPVLSGWNPNGTESYVEPVADDVVGATINIVSDTVSIAEPNVILPDVFNGQGFGYYVGYRDLNYKNPTGGNGYSDIRFKVPDLSSEPVVGYAVLALHSEDITPASFVEAVFNNTNIGCRLQLYFIKQGSDYFAGYSVYTQNSLVDGGGFAFPDVGDDIIIRLYDNGTIGQIINDTTQQVIANINNFALGALDLGLTATIANIGLDDTTSITLEYDVSHGQDPFTEISIIPNPPPSEAADGGGLVMITANGSYDNKNLQIGDYVLFYNEFDNIVAFRLPLTDIELLNLINQSITDSLNVGNPAYNAILALFNTGAVLYNTVEAIAQNAALSVPSLTAQQHFDLNKKIASIQDDYSIDLLSIYTVLIVGNVPSGELSGFTSGQCVMVVDDGSGGKVYTGVTADIGQRYYLESESLYLLYDPYSNFLYETSFNLANTLPESWRIDIGTGNQLRATQTHNINQSGFTQINVNPFLDSMVIINKNEANSNQTVVIGNFSSDAGQNVCAEGIVILRNNTNSQASMLVLFDGVPNVYGDFNNANILNNSSYVEKAIDTYGHIVLKWIKSKTSFFVDFKVFYTLDDQQYFNKPRLPFESFNAGDYNSNNALILPPYARVCFINGAGSNYTIQGNVSRIRLVYDEVTLKFAENNANVTMPDGTIKSPQAGESYSYVNIDGQYIAI